MLELISILGDKMPHKKSKKLIVKSSITILDLTGLRNFFSKNARKASETLSETKEPLT